MLIILMLLDQIKSLKLAAILNIGFFGSVIIITLLAFHGGVKLTFVGVICAGLTIGMYASPLSAMVNQINIFSSPLIYHLYTF